MDPSTMHADWQFVIMTVMLLGKLRGLPTHTDIITDFDFREVSPRTSDLLPLKAFQQ